MSLGAVYHRHVNISDEVHSARTQTLSCVPSDLVVYQRQSDGHATLPAALNSITSLDPDDDQRRFAAIQQPRYLAYDYETVKHSTIDQLHEMPQSEQQDGSPKKYTMFINPRVTETASGQKQMKHATRRRLVALAIAVADLIITATGFGTADTEDIGAVSIAVFVFFVFACHTFAVVVVGMARPMLQTFALALLFANFFTAFFEQLNDILVARLAIVVVQILHLLRVRSLSSYVWFTP